MTRPDGFYWVKWRGHWVVAWWDLDTWWIPQREEDFTDADFEEIGQKVEREL